MLETEHEEFEEPDYPSFPVVFQRQLEEEFQQGPSAAHSRTKKTISVPQNQANTLMRLTETKHETKYPHLFTQPLESKQFGVHNFFLEYLPIDERFVQEMKKEMQSLKLFRLGHNKICIGDMKDGKLHGKCIIVFKNGNLYEGEMLENKRSGKGIFINVNTGWYQGQFKNDLKNGTGVQVFYHKSAYKGSFLNGLRHDKGLYVDEDRNIYEGTWKLGIMHGKGSLKMVKSMYKGNFVNFLKHGSGEQHFSNGDVYRGQYQNGRFDGIGTYEWKSEEAIYEGNFKNGLRHGKGKWQRGETKYNGGYSQGLKEGYGQIYYPSGNFYKGNFINDKKEGYGQMFWTDSSFYKGQWKSGTQNGKGQIYMIGGDIISGIFENGMLVQAMPSIYEKQMEISNMKIEDLFGKPKVDKIAPRTRTFSQKQGLPKHKKLTKINESSHHKKHNVTGSIHDKLYFKSPDKSDHSDGDHRQCTRCERRLKNFLQKQRKAPRGSAAAATTNSHSKEHHNHHHHHHHH